MIRFATWSSGGLGALEGDPGRGFGVFVEVGAGRGGVAHGAGFVAAAAHEVFGALEQAALGGLVGFIGGRGGGSSLFVLGAADAEVSSSSPPRTDSKPWWVRRRPMILLM